MFEVGSGDKSLEFSGFQPRTPTPLDIGILGVLHFVNYLKYLFC